MDYDIRVRDRLGGQGWFERMRRKAHELRKLVAGDLSGVYDRVTQQRMGEEPPGESFVRAQELYDVLTTDYVSGRSTKLLQTVRTLMMQSGFAIPVVDFPELGEEAARLNNLYLRTRLGSRPQGCSASDQMRLALLDYLICGLGWSLTTLEGGAPIIRYADLLDVSWDLSVRLLTDIRWASVRVREPSYVWAEMFGKKEFESDERILELEFYYDVEGPGGHAYVWRREGSALSDRPLDVSENGYYAEYPTGRRSLLPLTPCYYLHLPSVRFPISTVEMMLPAQIARWDVDEHIRTATERGLPFWLVTQGALSAEALDSFERGECAAVVERGMTGAVDREPGLEIPSSLLQWRQMADEELTAAGGVNPYAAGGRIKGIDYAAEVQAIQGAAGLTAASIAKDHVKHWETTLHTYLHVAAAYDDMPLRLMVEGYPLDFGPEMPASAFIRPGTDLVVREDSVQFRPREQAVQEALADVSLFTQLGGQYPNGLRMALERYLRAKGISDAAQWLESPGIMGQMVAEEVG